MILEKNFLMALGWQCIYPSHLGNAAKKRCQMAEFAEELDATGLLCPLPVLKARKAMKRLEAGDCLFVRATDPGSVKDFAAFCEAQGHRLVSSESVDEEFHYLIEKGA